MTQWSLEPVWDSYAAVGVIGAGLLVLLFTRSTRRRLAPRQRRLLIGLRFAIVLLIILAMLRPTHVNSVVRRQSASLLVLFDISQSMQLPSSAGGASRYAEQRETLEAIAGLLRRLAKDLDVKIYGYDSTLHELPLRSGALAMPAEPEGEQTDIGTAIHEAIRKELGKRLAGVVLLGDGAQTAFQPQVDIQQAGRELARMGAPLYAVAFGPAGDSSQGRDIAVENLPDHFTVFVKNELVVRGLLRVRGYVNQQLPVELVVRDEEGKDEVLGPVMARAREDGEQVRVELNYVPQEPGRYTLTLRAKEQPGELVVENNELTAFLTVLEGGLRVLYVEGQPRWESKFVRQAIDASLDMQVDEISIDHQRRDQWPLDLTEVLEQTQYDVIIIGDVDSQALSEATIEQLTELVGRGTGLMMTGGFHSFGPGGYRTTPLADALPIVMDMFERQDLDAPIRTDLHVPGPLRMVPVREHPVVQLDSAQENEATWQQLPELQGANKFFEIKDAPGVEVIAATPEGIPLLVGGQYGAGRVLAFAGDSTWRWAMQGFDSAHRRFWRQSVLWLSHREDLARDEVWVDLDQRRHPRGVPIRFTAGARTSAGDPLSDAQLTAELIAPSGERETLDLTQSDEQLEGVIPPRRIAGRYAIEAVARQGDQILGKARADFDVLDRNAEFANPAADPDQFVRLAAMTSAFDGRAVAPEQLPAILAELEKRPPELEVEVQTRWQLGDTALDAWLFLLLVVGLLTTEWWLRKKWGMV